MIGWNPYVRIQNAAQTSQRRGFPGLYIAGMIVFLGGCRASHAPSVSTPAPPAIAPVRFHDVASSAGLTYRWGHPSRTGLNILQTIGHGCAFLDYDGDGRLDILLVGSDHCLLYRNKGDGTFEDVTDRAFPGAPRRRELLGCAVGDYDGDGRPDIFVTGYGRTILYHNEGNGTFKDVTQGSGLEARGPYDWTTSAAWADVDGDGKLDLYVCRYVRFTPDRPQLCPWRTLDGKQVMMACGPETYPSEKGSLYRNDGNGHFHDVTAASGLDTAHGNALACMFCDFNGDGKPDLYVANDQQPGDLFVNVGQGRFVNRGIAAGVAYNANGALPGGMGVDWGDYDGDGRFDLLVADFAAQPKSLYHNDGDTRFSQMSYPSGLGRATVLPLAFGAAFLDADNDGRLDIVLTNGHVLSEIEKVDQAQSYAQSTQFFHNRGGGRFEEISAQAGPDFSRRIVGRGIAVGDYDGDGREDLLVVDDEGAPLLLHNDSPPNSHWISLRCLWRPGGGDAVGARILLSAGGRKQIGEVRASGSYLSTNAQEVHFGLGASARADQIEIRWPDGRASRFTHVTGDRAYRINPEDTTLR